MTSDPKAPGAPAIILSYEETDDSDSAEVTVHVRIKVLTDGGLDAANLHIPTGVVQNDAFEQLFQARTIHRDGTIIPYTKSTQNTHEDEDASEKIIAVPAVQVGSIVEYAFHFASQNTLVSSLSGYYFPIWRVQRAYFVRSARFVLKTNPLLRPESLRWVATLPPGVNLQRAKGHVELNVQDVPAIPDEEFMPPRSVTFYNVRFFLWSPDWGNYWGETGSKVDDSWQDFYRPSKTLVNVVKASLAPTDTDEQKLRKLYALVENLENTDLTRSRTQREDKQAGLKEAHNSEDIWNRRRGSSDQLTLLFIALCRAAGYHAYPMAVASRDHAVFDQNVLSWSQVDSMLAIVMVNGREHFFDPGTRLCPFAHLAPWHSDVIGVSSEDKLIKIRSTPPQSFAEDRIERRADLDLAPNGAVTGKVMVAWTGLAGLSLRRQALREDEQAAQTAVEKRIQEQVPAGVELKLVSLKGLADGEVPLIAEFEVSGTLGIATQKRVLVPAQFFQSTAKPLLSPASRTAPVSFPEAYALRDQLQIHLSPQLSVETLPEARTLSVQADAAYNTQAQISQKDPRLVVSQRIFILKRIDWKPEEYASLHTYFGQLASHDQDQIILHLNPAQADAR